MGALLYPKPDKPEPKVFSRKARKGRQKNPKQRFAFPVLNQKRF
jgi:hypothetical protein